MKRLGIFLIYDREGIVDEYIYFLLEKMQSAYSELVIVCNCSLQPGYKERLQLFSREIYERENKGFDAGGFKDALNDYIGWDRVRTFEELLLFNDSFFGPFFPIMEVFDSMDNKNLDFWSMTKVKGNYKYASNIQSYFIVIKSSLLYSPCFEEYWMALPYYDCFDDVVREYEMKFAEYFEKKGFIWDAYIDPDRYLKPRNNRILVSLYHTVPNEIIEEQHYPFLKRKLFIENKYGFGKQSPENFIMALKYIQNNTDYNMDYIWDNILRTYSLRSIQDSCCSINVIEPSGVKNSSHNVKAIVWLLDQRTTYKNVHRIFSQLDLEDIVIGTDSHGLAGYLNEQYGACNILECPSSTVFWKKILADIKETEQQYAFLICFTDISCEPEADEYYVSKASVVWNRWENILGESGYVDKIQNYLKRERHIGMLAAPRLLHGRNISEGYVDEPDVMLAERFEVQYLIRRSEYLADWSESFWIRNGLINQAVGMELVEMLDEGCSIDSIAKILPYICQKNKYLTEVVESTTYAAVYEKIQAVYIQNFVGICNDGRPESTGGMDFRQMKRLCEIKKLNEYRILSFVKRFEQVYMYGCGEIADLLCRCKFVDNLCGFIVSDGKRNSESFWGKPVFELSEIEPENEKGIIVALDEKNTLEVKASISEKFDVGQILFLENFNMRD